MSIWLRVPAGTPVRGATRPVSIARTRSSTDNLGLVTGFTQAFRECSRFYRCRVKQHLDTLVKRLCADLPHALHRCEQSRDALLAFLTVEALVADDFECNGLEHG